MRIPASLTCAAAIALLLPASAPAASVEVTGGGAVLWFSGGPGEENSVDIAIDPSGPKFLVTEVENSLTAGPGCKSTTQSSDQAVPKGVAECAIGNVDTARVDLGDGDDSATLSYAGGPHAVVTGGSGIDTFLSGTPLAPATLALDGVSHSGVGGRTNDLLDKDIENGAGTTGNDTIIGNDAANVLTGGRGQDTITAGAGDDLIQSDEYIDTSDEPAGGPAGETDTISCGEGFDIVDGDVADNVAADCEVVARNSLIFGTNGDDRINAFREGIAVAGDAGNDLITGVGRNDLGGGSGNDRIQAGDTGPNSIAGGSGNDSLRGGDAKDSFSPGYGDDKVWGGGGNDRIDSAGAGRDTISGGAGNDYIVSKERGSERDVVRCGSGKDKVLADKNDRVSKDCEKVTRR
jgi:Ca2+-binding RTX toxin-like protein